MAGYSKLFSEIVTSSIWSEDDKTRIVWITMLALKNSRGFVPAAVPGLANAARVSIPECQQALAKLEAPDQYSRTPDKDGRRIEKADGGWIVLNHGKYRDKRSDDERKEYQRRWQQEHRRRQNVDNVDSLLTSDDTVLTHSDADADTDKNKRGEEAPPPVGIAARIQGIRPEFKELNQAEIENVYKAWPREVWESATLDFIRDVVNALQCPAMPLKMLNGYLSKAQRERNPGATPQRQMYPGEAVKLLEELRKQRESLINRYGREENHRTVIQADKQEEHDELCRAIRKAERKVLGMV